MNNAPETMSQPFTSTSCAKSGRKLLQVLEHRPEQSFSQHSVATLIGMGKVVATRSSSSAQSRKRTAVQSQRVTDVVKADSVGQLREKHADDMTPCAEGSRHGIHPGLACEFRNKMRRNEIAKLPKNAEFGCGWFGVSFFHLCRVTELKNHSNHFFLCFNQDFYGTGVISTSMVAHAMKCGPGTPMACRILANASGPLASLAKPCSKKPKPTIKRTGMSAHRSIANR